jgi:hypothetical protein
MAKMKAVFKLLDKLNTNIIYSLVYEFLHGIGKMPRIIRMINAYPERVAIINQLHKLKITHNNPMRLEPINRLPIHNPTYALKYFIDNKLVLYNYSSIICGSCGDYVYKKVYSPQLYIDIHPKSISCKCLKRIR